MRVGYQGEPGAYSEEAAASLFPGRELVGYRAFSHVFDAVAAGDVAAAVLPVENTLGGIVQEVNDLLWERSGLRLIREHIHPVRHCLLGRRDEPITHAVSHPQALAQVRRYLEVRGIEPVPFHDTAGAARELAERPRPGYAAVASGAAAERHGLEVLAAGIQDDDSNQTRFVVAEQGLPSRPECAAPGAKTSLCFVAAHVPGSLVGALECFSSRRVNLSRLESRPIPEQPFNYRFFLDFQVAEPAVAEEALRKLEATALEVRLFGTYPAAAT